ncbi:hypothetical protein [Streptomyces sp. NPDC093149]|uniref:DUF7691 family protein n=1 Tax=Streptomyces sp. NPDC093149 TaxID=3366031 RepID=UPI00381F7A28
MSHGICYSTADQADVLAFLGSNGNLTADQQSRLESMRDSARARQTGLDHQEVDWGLTVPEALDHLLAGRMSSEAERAGNAYHAALQIVIDHNACDPYTLGTYADPSRFFGLVDEELRRLGVPGDLLPGGYLFGGLPDGFPGIPRPVDGYPAIGHLPLDRAKPAADAYGDVLARMAPDFWVDVQELMEILEFEHEQWWYSKHRADGYTQDTLFFSLT